MSVSDDRRKGRERDADVAREAIMNAAERIFADKGFEGARVDAIAEASGYNKALLFHYFESKELLYQALIERMIRRNKVELSAIFQRLQDTDTRLQREDIEWMIAEAVRKTFSYYQRNPFGLRMMAWEAASEWRMFRRCATDFSNATALKIMPHVLAQAQADGYIRPNIDPIFLVTHLLNMTFIHLLSLGRLQKMFPQVDFTSPEALAYAREQLVQLALGGALVCHDCSERSPHVTPLSSDVATSPD